MGALTVRLLARHYLHGLGVALQMKLALFDGDKTIGGAKFAVHSGNTSLLLDFGLNFSKFGRLFGEFLQPRGCRGLHDLWHTGLIPPFSGAYRKDLFPADFRPSEALKFAPDAVVVSHAHLDHMGLLGAIRTDIPIACSTTTAMIMKSLQDTGQSVSHQEYAYAVPRIANGSSSTIKSCSYTTPAISRPLMTLDSCPEEAARFWSMSHNGRFIGSGNVTPEVSSIGSFSIKSFPVDHSVPGCVAVEVRDESTHLIYTGDLRTHGSRGADTSSFIDRLEADPPDVLIVEGTRIGRASDRVVTEREVAERAFEIVRASAGRLVIADFGGRHMERLASFATVASQLDRRLLISTKDAHLLEAIALVDSDYDLLGERRVGIYADPRAVEQKWEQRIRSVFKELLVYPAEVTVDPGFYVLAFSVWDMPEMLDLACDSGVYIYSSSEAYGEDSRLQLYQLWNWICQLRMELHGFTWEGGETGKPIFTPGLNASGHIDENSLRELLLRVQPAVVVPVHTERPEWFEHVLMGTRSRVAHADARGRVLLV
jgi:ribonuclease J